MPENEITEHWLVRGIQSAIFYYFSCGPCIVIETKWRRQSQARRERKQRQKARREKMEYRKRKSQQGETEDEEERDDVVEMEVTDTTGTSRVLGVGMTGGEDEHIFLPFEINEYWGDEKTPSSDAPWWWKKLTGKDPNAVEPSVPIGQRGLGRKRFFTPSGEIEPESEKEKINRDDGDMWPLNESHPPILCKGEISKDEISWIKEAPPSPSAMRRMQGTVYEVDLDKLNQTEGYHGPITSHPAVTKIEFSSQYVDRRSSKSTKSSRSAATSPKAKISDPEKKSPYSEGNKATLSPSLSQMSEKFLSPPTPKLESTITPTGRPDSAVSASRLKTKPQPATKRIRSESHTASSSSEDADDEGEDQEPSPRTVPISKPKPTYRSSAGKTGHRSENISPRASPQTIGSAVSSSDSLTGENWLPPKMFGAKHSSNATTAGSTRVR